MRGLTIGKVAREAGVGIETIRFYERQQLLEKPPKPEGGGIRLYSPDSVVRIRFIREAQKLGFALREIRELLSLRCNPSADCSAVRNRAAAKLHEVRESIQHLSEIGARLEALIALCPGTGELQSCSIMDGLEVRARLQPSP